MLNRLYWSLVSTLGSGILGSGVGSHRMTLFMGWKSQWDSKFHASLSLNQMHELVRFGRRGQCSGGSEAVLSCWR